jgi:hypothetical protein
VPTSPISLLLSPIFSAHGIDRRRPPSSDQSASARSNGAALLVCGIECRPPRTIFSLAPLLARKPPPSSPAGSSVGLARGHLRPHPHERLRLHPRECHHLQTRECLHLLLQERRRLYPRERLLLLKVTRLTTPSTNFRSSGHCRSAGTSCICCYVSPSFLQTVLRDAFLLPFVVACC